MCTCDYLITYRGVKWSRPSLQPAWARPGLVGTQARPGLGPASPGLDLALGKAPHSSGGLCQARARARRGRVRPSTGLARLAQAGLTNGWPLGLYLYGQLGRARKSNEPLEGIICNFFFVKTPNSYPNRQNWVILIFFVKKKLQKNTPLPLYKYFIFPTPFHHNKNL